MPVDLRSNALTSFISQSESKERKHIAYIYIYIYICDMLFETPKILISLGMKTTILLTHVLEI